MKGFFYYKWKGKPDTSTEEIIFSFLFKPTGFISAETLAEGIELSGVAVPYPDNIIIQCANREYKELAVIFNGPVVGQALKRISKRSRVYLAGYGNEGRLSNLSQIGTGSNSSNKLLRSYLLLNHQEILQAGLKKLFSKKGVIQIAPSGYTFVKPSGDRSRVFLKTEEALSDSDRVQFVAFALLPRLAIRQRNFRTAVNSIYIDTMGIASVAYALRDLYWGDLTDGQQFPRIESFHSHSGLDDFETPLNGTAFCLISASQSMRMQKMWKKKTNANDDEVVTLLTIKGVENSEQALFAAPTTKDGGEFSDANALHDIRIVGERFYPDQIKPRKVLLRNTVHQVQEMYELSKRWHTVTPFRLQVRKNNVVRPLYINAESILGGEDEHFNKWVDKICDQYVPLSIQAVVAQNDQPSNQLATEIIKRLKNKYTINLIEEEPVNETRILDGTYNPDRNRALLIVAAVIGKGTRLLSISRDLRDIHFGARCYVIGFQVAETQSQITTLKQNLKSPATKSRWDTVIHTALAIGKGLGNSFDSENKLGISREVGAERFNKLSGSSDGLVEDSFLPSSVNLSPLELREDFAYWPEIQYVRSATFAPLVFASVSALLQKGREDTTLPSNCQLSTEAYQNVVLDPENFHRYNDGVIQSAILRAAYPHELDYSCSSELSNTVKKMLLKVFENITKCQGEAAFEFALALRTGRLKIQKEHYDELINALRSNFDQSSAQLVTLNLLLDIDMNGDGGIKHKEL